jgi:hypothetical protein
LGGAWWLKTTNVFPVNQLKGRWEESFQSFRVGHTFALQEGEQKAIRPSEEIRK